MSSTCMHTLCLKLLTSSTTPSTYSSYRHPPSSYVLSSAANLRIISGYLLFLRQSISSPTVFQYLMNHNRNHFTTLGRSAGCSFSGPEIRSTIISICVYLSPKCHLSLIDSQPKHSHCQNHCAHYGICILN